MIHHHVRRLVLCWAVCGYLSACKSSIPAYDFADLPAPAAFTKDGQYVLAPMDKVSILVVGQGDASTTYQLSPDGDVALPLIGRVRVEGLTVPQLTQMLASKYRRFLNDPMVAVNLVQPDSYRISFSGEITTPGVLPFARRTSLIEGVTAAGGPTRFASGRIILMRRKQDGQLLRFETTWDEVLAGRAREDTIFLDRDDVVYFE